MPKEPEPRKKKAKSGRKKTPEEVHEIQLANMEKGKRRSLSTEQARKMAAESNVVKKQRTFIREMARKKADEHPEEIEEMLSKLWERAKRNDKSLQLVVDLVDGDKAKEIKLSGSMAVSATELKIDSILSEYDEPEKLRNRRYKRPKWILADEMKKQESDDANSKEGAKR